MDQNAWLRLALVGAALYFIWKKAPQPLASMALGVGGVIAAKQVPVIKEYV